MIIRKMALPRRTFLRGLGATLALPLLLWARQFKWEPRAVAAVSGVVLVLGLVLFVERVSSAIGQARWRRPGRVSGSVKSIVGSGAQVVVRLGVIFVRGLQTGCGRIAALRIEPRARSSAG